MIVLWIYIVCVVSYFYSMILLAHKMYLEMKYMHDDFALLISKYKKKFTIDNIMNEALGFILVGCLPGVNIAVPVIMYLHFDYLVDKILTDLEREVYYESTN